MATIKHHRQERDYTQYPKKVLIIEDDPSDYTIVKNLIALKYPNIEILYASCLEDAYKIYKNQQYNFIILDLNLPDGYGLGSIQEVRRFHGHTPILAMTGMMTDTIEKTAMSMGASFIMSKDDLNKPLFLTNMNHMIDAGHERAFL